MTQAEIALQIFCAMMASGKVKASIDPDRLVGEPQIRSAFVLAETFLEVKEEIESEGGDTR